MKEKELYNKYTIPEVFFELKKLRVVKMTNGKEYLTEVSKKQRTLFEKFEVPSSRNIVIKCEDFRLDLI